MPSPCSGEPLAAPDGSDGALVRLRIAGCGPQTTGPCQQLPIDEINSEYIIYVQGVQTAPDTASPASSGSREPFGKGIEGCGMMASLPDFVVAVPQSTSSHPASLPDARCSVNSRERPPKARNFRRQPGLRATGESGTKSRARRAACQPPASSGPSPVGPLPLPPISTRTNLRFPLWITCDPRGR